MKNPLLIIFWPLKAVSNFGCFGVFIGFIYVVIVAGIILSVAGKMLQGCSLDDGYSSSSSTQVHYPHSSTKKSSSKAYQGGNIPQKSNSAASIARSLNNQGYTIRKIRKYLKNNGYGNYRRKEIREMINN